MAMIQASDQSGKGVTTADMQDLDSSQEYSALLQLLLNDTTKADASILLFAYKKIKRLYEPIELQRLLKQDMENLKKCYGFQGGVTLTEAQRADFHEKQISAYPFLRHLIRTSMAIGYLCEQLHRASLTRFCEQILKMH